MSRNREAGRTLTLFAADSPVKTSRARASAAGSADSARGSGTTSRASSNKSRRGSWSSKTSPADKKHGCRTFGMGCTCSAIERAPWGLAPETWERPTCESGSSLLPTPTAASYGTSLNGNPRDGRTSFRGKGKPSLETMARHGLWPTMTRADAQRGARDLRKRKNGATLAQAVNLWATPLRRDDRGIRGGSLKQRSRALPNQAGGPLNPTWVEWLMGFPVDWTDGVAAPACARSATRSSRSARKSSAKSSNK